MDLRPVGREEYADRLVHVAGYLVRRRRLSGQEDAAQDAGMAQVEEVLGGQLGVRGREPPGLDLGVEVGLETARARRLCRSVRCRYNFGETNGRPTLASRTAVIRSHMRRDLTT